MAQNLFPTMAYHPMLVTIGRTGKRYDPIAVVKATGAVCYWGPGGIGEPIAADPRTAVVITRRAVHAALTQHPTYSAHRNISAAKCAEVGGWGLEQEMTLESFVKDGPHTTTPEQGAADWATIVAYAELVEVA